MSWSTGWGSSSKGMWDVPKRTTQPKVVHHDHGIIHNFLSDVRDMGVGFIPGVAKTGIAVAKATVGDFHPLVKMGKEIGHQYGHMYGPVAHGDVHTTLSRMKQHPLQPLLDALTIPTLGGAAYAKGVKLASDINTVEGAARVAKVVGPGAERVMVNSQLGPAAFRTLSHNPVTRWRQTQMNRLGNAASNAGTKLLLDNPERGNILHTTGATLQNNFLGDMHFQKKFNQMDRSAREAATATMFKRTMHAANRLFDDPTLAPEDIAAILDPHLRQNAIDLSREMDKSELLKSKSGRGLRAPAGWAFIHRQGGFAEYPHDKTPAAFRDWMHQYGRRMVTDRPSQALTRGNKYLLVRQHSIEDMIAEASHSYSFLHTMARAPLKLWKWSILATSPRYLVNNVIGNGLMYAMSANPISTIRGMHDAIRDVHGEKVAQRGLTEIEKAQRDITGDWIDKHYLGTTQGFSHEMMSDLQGTGKVRNFLKQGFFPITHKLSDTLVRRSAINYIIRRHPMYQSFYKYIRHNHPNLSKRDTHIMAADTVSVEPEVRAYVMKHVDDILGQYYHFNAAEKGVRSIVPFYSWDRAMMRHSLVMSSHRPYQAALMYQLDKQGMDEVKKYMDGPVPRFLEGAVPLKMFGLDGGNGVAGLLVGGKHPERQKMLTTQGLNPYSTLPDVTDAAASLAKGNAPYGEALASQVNPFITGAIQHYTGQSVVTGRRIKPHGGLIPDVLRNVAESTPLPKIAETAINGRPLPKIDSRTGKRHDPLLFRGDLGQQVRGFVGFPIKDVATKTAATLAAKEQGISTAAPKATKSTTPSWSGWGNPTTQSISSTRTGSRRRYRRHAAQYHFTIPKH